MYTNTGLVEHAKQCLSMDTRYFWGGIMRKATPAYMLQLARMYPTHFNSVRQKILTDAMNKYPNLYAVDCVGLIKSYYWGGIGSPKYSSSTDVNADSMLTKATEKGTINTIPEIPGICVQMKGHIGIYIGNGEVIESTNGSFGDGVVKTNLNQRKWTSWLKCPYIEYVVDSKEDGMTQEQFNQMVETYLSGRASIVQNNWSQDAVDWAINKSIISNANELGTFTTKELLIQILYNMNKTTTTGSVSIEEVANTIAKMLEIQLKG